MIKIGRSTMDIKIVLANKENEKSYKKYLPFILI